MKTTETISYPVQIWIAGDVERAHQSCREFCDSVGLCVTVTPTDYIYTGGIEGGVVIGLINYGRFPSEPREIFARAKELAIKLIADLGQESASIQASDKTLWISFREDKL